MHFQDTIGFLLHEVAQSFDAQSDHILLQQLGIGYAQFRVLTVIDERAGASQKEIASVLNQTEASISRQVKILHAQHLVGVTKDTTNLRVRRLYLTTAGQALITRATEVLNAYYEPLFMSLSGAQQKQIIESLRLMRAATHR